MPAGPPRSHRTSVSPAGTSTRLGVIDAVVGEGIDDVAVAVTEALATATPGDRGGGPTPCRLGG